MQKSHENYKELVWRLARTDFKLRYHGNALGYVWAIAKPLMMFTILNFVFSSIFNFRNSGTPNYPLELLTALLMFQFFSEGTMNGMGSLLSKSQLVTKIYVPKWTIVLSSTINSLFVFLTNLVVLSIFFLIYHHVPTLEGILLFFVYVVFLYALIVAFSFLTAAFFVRFRDLSTIWEVLLSALMYAAPIVYPLGALPAHLQKYILMNPLGFIIHFAKLSLISNTFAHPEQVALMALAIILVGAFSFWVFKRYEKRVAEHI
jgi:ABC-type polysaccharide/polyol phosphate export permease